MTYSLARPGSTPKRSPAPLGRVSSAGSTQDAWCSRVADGLVQSYKKVHHHRQPVSHSTRLVSAGSLGDRGHRKRTRKPADPRPGRAPDQRGYAEHPKGEDTPAAPLGHPVPPPEPATPTWCATWGTLSHRLSLPRPPGRLTCPTPRVRSSTGPLLGARRDAGATILPGFRVFGENDLEKNVTC